MTRGRGRDWKGGKGSPTNMESCPGIPNGLEWRGAAHVQLPGHKLNYIDGFRYHRTAELIWQSASHPFFLCRGITGAQMRRSENPLTTTANIFRIPSGKQQAMWEGHDYTKWWWGTSDDRLVTARKTMQMQIIRRSQMAVVLGKFT